MQTAHSSACVGRSCCVQIPPWFDANRSRTTVCTAFASFKFHRGSMQTPGAEWGYIAIKQFKFHRGSMQTNTGLLSHLHKRKRSNSTVVRCKLGYDNSRRGRGSVQIPPWFDANHNPIESHLPKAFVQIPPWFDANPSQHRPPFRPPFRSNSTVVRCKHIVLLSHLHKKKRSNSTVVRCKLYSSPREMSRSRVQIPPWFDANRSVA